MPRAGRPRRLDGIAYGSAGPVFHCRWGLLDRRPGLGEPGIAQIVVEALRHHHERNVEVLAYCVMPDHVHVLIAFRSKGVSLSRWVGDLKRWVSRRASSDLAEDLQRQPSFYEHVVRSDEDAVVLARYILSNPVRAGLVEDWRNFPWSGSFAWQL